MKRRVSQAYQQAPWRKRVQRAALVALVVICVIFVGMIYLNISAQAASAGMQYQTMQLRIAKLNRSIASLQTEFAFISSYNQMKARADELGYKPLSLDRAIYVIVPGYTGRQPVTLAPPPGADMIPPQIVKAAYNESIWDVITRLYASRSQSEGSQQ